MSSGGRSRVVRPTQMEKCAEVIAKTASEFAPAAQQAIQFFGQGMADWLTAAHDERFQAYQAELQREGAANLDFTVPQLVKESRDLSTQILQACRQLQMAVPDQLVQPPSFVTAPYVAAQQQVLKTVTSLTSIPQTPPDFSQVIQAVTQDQEEVSRAADQLKALNAKHTTLHPGTIPTPQTLVAELNPERRRQVLSAIADASGTLRVEEQVAESWAAMLLALSAQAAQEIGFINVTVDIERGVLVASDPEHEGAVVEVKAESATNTFQYDLKGYQGKACKAPERKFLDALREWAGADFVDGIQQYEHETEGTRVVTPRKTKPVKTDGGRRNGPPPRKQRQ